MGNLRIETKLADLVGKTWMYKTKTYKITDVLVIGQEHIIATDSKTLRIATDKVEDFLAELLPCANDDLPARSGGQLAIPGVEAGTFSELAKGLMTSFREIQGAKDEHFQKQARLRASSKIAITRAITDIAKKTMQAQKMLIKKGE